MPTYTISSARPAPNGAVIYGIVTDQLQRMAVMVPRSSSTEPEAREIIDHAIAGRARRPKPVRTPREET